MKDALVPIGVVKKAFGIKGSIRVKTYSGEGYCLSPNFYIFLEKTPDNIKRYKIKSSKPFKDFFIVQLEELSSANEAEDLVGATVLVERSSFPTLGEDEYYLVDLIGCEIYGIDGTFLGILKNIMATGGVDVFEIEKDKEELLIPFSRRFVKSISIEEKKIIVDAEPFL